jgi:type VI secretion system protein ImpC
MTAATVLELKRFLSSVRLAVEPEMPSLSTLQLAEDAAESPPPTGEGAPAAPVVSSEARFVAGLAALVLNVDPTPSGAFSKGKLQEVILAIDAAVSAQLDEILHHERFQAIESAWRAIEDLVRHVNFKAGVTVDVLDVTKEELAEDFDTGSVDVTETALFKKIYYGELDQFGGKPFAAMIGLYSFSSTRSDVFWLKQMGKVAGHSHAPFFSSVSPAFFGCETVEQLSELGDLDAILSQPRYGPWHALRDGHEAAYLGLTLPRYLLRRPWHSIWNPAGTFAYEEKTGGDNRNYLWGNSAILVARNLAKSFESSGWCQYIRGHKAGGLASDLEAHRFRLLSEHELKSPLEWTLPDTNEVAYANAGFMPVVYRKGTDEACFFSSQSVKAVKRFGDQRATDNAQLVTNLAYTLSISRIAHYLKCIVRDVVGSTADGPYVQRKIQKWLETYVTMVPQPSERTISYYPFKMAKVEVRAVEGDLGSYKCAVTVVPHIQFEGVDVELRLESWVG